MNSGHAELTDYYIFVCSACGQEHTQDESKYVCRDCGPIGILEPALRTYPATLASLFTTAPGMWRYEQFLSLSPTAPRPPLTVGGTPLLHAGRLADSLNLPHLYIKNDSLNPTGSLKDRASAVVLARAAEMGVGCVAVASTGNAGSSLAGLAASIGLPVVIFVPDAAPRAKLVQSLAYGAQVFAVQGTYDDAFELCMQACEHFGWYNRNTAFNPLTLEGKKTVAYEIYEGLGNRAPDAIFVPTGDGCIVSGVARGFRDLRSAKLIDRLPHLFAVQARGSDAIARSLSHGGPPIRIGAHSVADSITVSVPRNGAMAVRDIRESGGYAPVVDDEDIVKSLYELAATTGIFAEPAAAASLAGLHQSMAEGTIDPHWTIVLLVTGTGLKDIESASRSIPGVIPIAPTLSALQGVLRT